MNQYELLTEVLLELRVAARAIDSEASLKSTMRKYDMLFMGENFNYITSIELAHTIRTIFDLPITNEELLKITPAVCSALGMNYEAMSRIENAGTGSIDAFTITLF
ncbi:hypothetical protein [Brevibacillus porteri]|uniref:hypothetical protein n=1 Tax=Brevibacillus porteri TaxID=2126350 RepID=UPI003D203689